jgi:BirA family biotin operon repressor/biotin-[acetyl-CoA-carboxylase] ligase
LVDRTSSRPGSIETPGSIEIISETGSTSSDLASRLIAGDQVAEGSWLVADRQTAGRGRLGRSWSDGSGNFMGSTNVKLTAGDPPAPSLALVAGLAVHDAVSGHIAEPDRAMLKWPNDLLVNGVKLAGILLERVGDRVVVGIGVNLAQAPQVPDRETLALTRYGPAPDRDGFAEALAGCFAAEVLRWRSYGLGPLIQRWQAAGHPPGTPLCVVQPDGGRLSGTFAGLGEDGALRLALPDGTTRIIHAGEVLLAYPD